MAEYGDKQVTRFFRVGERSCCVLAFFMLWAGPITRPLTAAEMSPKVRDDDLKRIKLRKTGQGEGDRRDRGFSGSSENAPARVTMISVSEGDGNTLTVSWQPTGQRGIVYRIYRDNEELNAPAKLNRETLIDTVDEYHSDYTDKNLPTGRYFYAVTTMDKFKSENRSLIVDQSYTSYGMVVIDEAGDRERKTRENRQLAAVHERLDRLSGFPVLVRRDQKKERERLAKIERQRHEREAEKKRKAVEKKRREEELARKQEAERSRHAKAEKDRLAKSDDTPGGGKRAPSSDGKKGERPHTVIPPYRPRHTSTVVSRRLSRNYRVFFSAGDYGEYISYFKREEETLRRYPMIYERAKFFLGRAYYRQGDYRQAVHVLVDVKGELRNVATLLYKECLKRTQ